MYLYICNGIGTSSDSNLCPVSSLINTVKDGQLPYPIELYSHNNNIENVDNNNNNDNDNTNIYKCNSYSPTVYPKKDYFMKYDNISIPLRDFHCKHSICPITKNMIHESLNIMNKWDCKYKAICNLNNLNKLNELNKVNSMKSMYMNKNKVNKQRYLRNDEVEVEVSNNNNNNNDNNNNNNNIVKKKINILVFGGSMTIGTDVNGVCCLEYNIHGYHPIPSDSNSKCVNTNNYLIDEPLQPDKYYCNWFGQLSRWFRIRYPYIDFEFHNLAVGGTGSRVMATEVYNVLKHHKIQLNVMIW